MTFLAPAWSPGDYPEVQKKNHLEILLDQLCTEIELSPTSRDRAEQSYTAVGAFLSEGAAAFTRGATIYPQGSVALGTTIRPLVDDEYDVDLVCYLPNVPADAAPSAVKRLVGERLRSHAYYSQILEEKRRCWRLNYAGDFHLDITPSIRNVLCNQGGEFVPDKELRSWKESNPKGYRRWFEEIAKLVPRPTALRKSITDQVRRARVEPYPEPLRRAGILRRIVQLLKRHRDLYFQTSSELAPISIVVTTLTASSYYHCVTNNSYDSDFDVIVDVLKGIPHFIQHDETGFLVANPSTFGENFAERWNTDIRLAESFCTWSQATVEGFSKLLHEEGRDRIQKSLTASFGERDVKRVFTAEAERMAGARQAAGLAIVPGVGLHTSIDSGLRVPRHTFFGR